jgi:hypothetical protein
LRLITPIDCTPHPYWMYRKCFSCLRCFGGAYGCTLTLLCPYGWEWILGKMGYGRACMMLQCHDRGCKSPLTASRIHLGCIQSVVALPWPCLGLALALPWPCLGLALALPWPCLGLALALPWPCLGLALALPWPSSEVLTKMILMGHPVSSCHVPVVRSCFIFFRTILSS